MLSIRCRIRVLGLLLASLPGASAWAQIPPTRADAPIPSASNGASAGLVRDQQARQRASAVPWSQLSNEQRSVLAPLQSQWAQLPPQRQQRLAGRAQAWARLPPEPRRMVGERLQRWAQMTPQQRQAAAHGAHAFRNLSDADRQRLMETYQRFQALPPEQRRALLRQWRMQHARERGMREPPVR